MVATERRRARVRKQRDSWIKHRLPAVSTRPECVVFIDETSVKTNLSRQRGWSRWGKRLILDAPLKSLGTQTSIAGLSAAALIALLVIKGAPPGRFGVAKSPTRQWMGGEAFAAYVEQMLVLKLRPAIVVILDNLATPKKAAAVKAKREAGCWFLRLPPYNRDLNPTEMAFSKLKSHLRRIGAPTLTDMSQV